MGADEIFLTLRAVCRRFEVFPSRLINVRYRKNRTFTKGLMAQMNVHFTGNFSFHKPIPRRVAD